MTEEQIREIAREEYAKMFDKNFTSGSPRVPPHSHNMVDNIAVLSPLIVQTSNGSTKVLHVNTIKLVGLTLTDDGGGVVTITHTP